MLSVDVRSRPSAVTLACSGRIVLGVEAETLRCIASSRPEQRIDIDLERVHAIDAAGLGLLVELHCWARQHRRELAILNPSVQARRLMALTNLESVFDIRSVRGLELSEQEAMTA